MTTNPHGLAPTDLAHSSSHWQEWGAKHAGFGTQGKMGLGDWLGIGPLILTSRDWIWALSRMRSAIAVHRAMGLAFTQDSVRQLCTLALLRKHIEPRTRRILVIGDGFGVFAALFRAQFPTCDIQLVDLSFALDEQRRRLTAAFGPGSHFTFTHAGDIERWSSLHFDLAVSVASMQEMDPLEVDRYFAFMRGRVKLFYCCGRERKELPDGTVSLFTKYPWSHTDDVLLDEHCPWHQWLMVNRPPFFQRYDGPIRHRLARLGAGDAPEARLR
jgi:hypothetical protein